MKRILMLFCILILFVFVGCGTKVDEPSDKDVNKDDTVSEEENQEPEEEEEPEEDKDTSGEEPDITEIDFMAQLQMPEPGQEVAIMTTNYGVIKLRFFPNVAPKAVENFLTHSKNGYYDGLTFHRVMIDFMIQGGDPTGTGEGGESIWGESFEDEFSAAYFPYSGALCMANSGANTNGSQFFIVQLGQADEGYVEGMIDGGFPEEMVNNYEELGGTPWLYGKHTVFGQVYEGMDVVDTIAGIDVGEKDKPVEDVIIEKIEVVTYDPKTT